MGAFYVLLYTPKSKEKGRALKINLLKRKPDPKIPVQLIVTTDDMQMFDSECRTGLQTSIALAANISWMASRNLSPKLPVAFTLHMSDSEHLILDGGSGGLAFVLATVARVCGLSWGLVGATGVLEGGHGEIREVRGLEHKLKAFCDGLESGEKHEHAVLFLPKNNQSQWPSLPDALKERLGRLTNNNIHWVDHVCEALEILSPGVFPNKNRLVVTPFMGLQSFNFEDHWCYFGRESEIDYLHDLYMVHEEKLSNKMCDKRRTITIRGSSGTGKSSFAKAGLIPLMVYGKEDKPPLAEYCWTVFRPSECKDHILDAFANSLFHVQGLWAKALRLWLKEQWGDSDSLGSFLIGNPEEFTEKLFAFMSTVTPTHSNASGLIVLIDQLEELFTYSAITNSQQEQLFNLIFLLSGGRHQLYFIMTIRDDYVHLIKNKHLKSCMMVNGDGLLVDLGDIQQGGIERIINKPIEAIGYEFEKDNNGRSLARLIEDDAKELNRTDTALPFLELKLSALYKLANEGTIPISGYHEGDLSKTIRQQADQAITQLGGNIRAGLHKLFYLLVGYSELENKLFANHLPLSLIKDNVELISIIQQLQNARIVIQIVDQDNNSLIRFVHESVISEWEEIDLWLYQYGAIQYLKLRNRLEQAYEAWEKSQKPRKSLLTGALLSDGRKYLKNPDAQVSNDVKDFIVQSIRRRRMRWLLREVLPLNAFIIILFAYLSSNYFYDKLQENSDYERMYVAHISAMNVGRAHRIKLFKCSRINTRFNSSTELHNYIIKVEKEYGKSDKRLVKLYQNLALLQYRNGQFELAIKSLGSARDIIVTTNVYHDLLALIYYKMAWLEYRKTSLFNFIKNNSSVTWKFGSRPRFVTLALKYKNAHKEFSSELRQPIKLLEKSLSLHKKDQCFPEKSALYSGLSWLYMLQSKESSAFLYRFRAIRAGLRQMKRGLSAEMKLKTQGLISSAPVAGFPIKKNTSFGKNRIRPELYNRYMQLLPAIIVLLEEKKAMISASVIESNKDSELAKTIIDKYSATVHKLKSLVLLQLTKHSVLEKFNRVLCSQGPGHPQRHNRNDKCASLKFFFHGDGDKQDPKTIVDLNDMIDLLFPSTEALVRQLSRSRSKEGFLKVLAIRFGVFDSLLRFDLKQTSM